MTARLSPTFAQYRCLSVTSAVTAVVPEKLASCRSVFDTTRLAAAKAL